MCMQLLTFTMRARHNTTSGSSYPYKNEVVENITNRVINYTRDGEISTGEVKKMVELLNDKDSLGWS